MNADGSNESRITNYPGFDFNPCWSPDGTRIAFTHITEMQPSNNYDIFVMNANGTGLTNLTTIPAFDNEAYWLNAPAL